MPGGGRITIETGNRWMDRHGARQHDMPEGQYLSLCVSDTGTGMPPEVIAKAFDPFFTTKPIGQGTGLGLSMIYGFAKPVRGPGPHLFRGRPGHDGLHLSAPSSRRRRRRHASGPETGPPPLGGGG